MRTNIPSFRLPSNVLDEEIDQILNMGIETRFNTEIKSMKSLLEENFDAVFVGTGYYIIQKYNKTNTKLLDELQTGQYFGIVLAFLGLLPWVQYFFMSFMFEGGSYAFDSLMSE